jgi:hypothetical protein
MDVVDTNVTFNTRNNEQRAGFDIVSNPKFGMLNGLSIPSGICLYKNKRYERMFPVSDTLSDNCIPESLYDKLLNLARYTPSKKTHKTRNFKKSKLAGSKTSNKKNTRHKH